MSQQPQTTIYLSQPQTKFIVSKKKFLCYASGVGGGKAQPLSSLVLTPKGFVTMGSIVVGSEVLTPSNTIATVTHIHPQGEQDIYELTFVDGANIRATKEHLFDCWISERGQRTRKLRTVEELMAIKSRIIIPLSSALNFGDHYNDIDSYTVGALLGDGHIGRRLSFTTNDSEILKQLIIQGCTLTKHKHRYEYGIVSNAHGVNGYPYNTLLVKLRKLGLGGITSEAKFIPKEIKFGSLENRRDVLQGLMDTDGTVDANGRCSFTSKSHQLALDVQYIVRSLGGKATLSKEQKCCIYKGKRVCGEYYRIYINIADKTSLFRLKRKINRCTPFNGGASVLGRRLLSIKLVGRENAQCITISSGEGLYVSNDFIVTHNSFSGCLKIGIAAEAYPENLLLIGRKTGTLLRDSTLQDFLGIYGYRKDCQFNKADNIFTFPNGSKVLFRHLDDINAFKNLNLGGFWIDQAEEISEGVYNLLAARLRRNNVRNHFGALTCNAEAHNWIWKRWKLRSDRNQLTKDHELVEGTTLDNRNNLPPSYIEDLINTWPAEVVNQLIYNKWDAASGAIFPELDEGVHFIPPFEIPEHWARMIAIDHGIYAPTAVIFAAIDPEGRIYVYDEHYKNNVPVAYHAQVIKSKIEKSVWGGVSQTIESILIDPSTKAKIREKNNKMWSVLDEYIEHGINAVPADNDLRAGINMMKERFHFTYDSTGGRLTKPKLMIFQTCNNLWGELINWKWKQVRGTNATTDNKYRDVPSDEDNHGIDALRYIILDRPLPNQTGDFKDYARTAGKLNIIAAQKAYDKEVEYSTDDSFEDYSI